MCQYLCVSVNVHKCMDLCLCVSACMIEYVCVFLVNSAFAFSHGKWQELMTLEVALAG